MGWKAPPDECIKINVDASFVESLKAASVGIMARNSTGNIILSSWDYIERCSSVDKAELKACLVGLYIGMTLHSPIIIETDCAFMVSFLSNENFDRSPLVNIKVKHSASQK